MVASNHLDIQDVDTFDRLVTGDVDICYEKPEENLEQYYWRQSYDVRDGSLSISQDSSALSSLL